MSLGGLWRDGRLTVRALTAAPAFATLVIGILTLGLGASLAIYAVVDSTVLRGLPFPGADRLVAIGDVSAAERGDEGETSQDFLDWRDRQDVFSAIAASGYGGFTLSRDGLLPPENLTGAVVTSHFFDVLGVSPLLGHTFTVDNERASASGVAVLSYALWQRRFGGRPDIIGRRVGGVVRDLEVIGVMPASFTYPVGAPDPIAIWLPKVFEPADRVRGTEIGRVLTVIGRLRPGVSVNTARAEMQGMASALGAASPGWARHVTVEPLHAVEVAGARTWMVMLLGAVACVLLIACVNVANLMLARAVTREPELRVRAALGGSGWDLARVLVTESLLLALLGTGLGVLVARGSVDVLRTVLPPDVPGVANIAINGRVLACAVFAALAVGLGCGLLPALKVARPIEGRLLLATGRTQTSSAERMRTRAMLVVAEVALAVVLLVGAGLFLTSFARVTAVDLGFDYHDVRTLRVRPLESATSSEALDALSARHRAAFDAILTRVRALPSVREVALLSGNGLPLRGELFTEDVRVPGRATPFDQEVQVLSVSPGYLHLLRMPVLQGRDLADSDRPNGPGVVVLNQSAVAAYFAGVDPLGRTIEIGKSTWIVVGVVRDIRYGGPETAPRRQAFIPSTQAFVGGATVMVRTADGSPAIDAAIEEAVWAAFPNVPLDGVVPLESYLRAMLAPRRLNMVLLSIFAILGLAIAAIGIYAVTAFLVARRTREIGIRLALGAPPATVRDEVILQAIRPVAVGLAVGSGAAWVFAVFLERFLFGVSAHASGVYVAAMAVLLVTGLVAAAAPAYRASRLDPLEAVRVD